MAGLDDIGMRLIHHYSNAIYRAWIIARIAEVRQEIAALDWPLGTGLIHGDAWAGNLLSCPG